MNIKYVTFYLFFYFICNNSLYSQNDAKFEQKLQSVKGKERFKLLIQASDSLLNLNNSQALQYALEAYDIAMEQNDNSLKLDANNMIGYAYKSSYKYAESIRYFQYSITLAQITKCDTLLIEIYNNIGINYRKLNQIDKSLEALKKSEYYINKFGNKQDLSDIKNNLSNTYRQIGDYDNALKYLLDALRIANEQKFLKSIPRILNNIGNIYGMLENNRQALDFYEKALKGVEKINDKSLKSIILNNLGNVHQKLKNYDRALELLQLSLEIKEKLGDKPGKAIATSNLGEVYQEKGMFEKSANCFNTALELKKELNDQKGIATVNLKIGILNLKRNKLKEAKSNLDETLLFAYEKGCEGIRKDLFENYAKYYAMTGDYKKSNEFKDKFIAIKDSIMDLERTRRLNELFLKFSIEQKDKDLELAKKEGSIRDLELDRQKSVGLLLVIIIVLLIGIITISLYQLRMKSRFQKKLIDKNEELITTQYELKAAYEKEKELNKLKSNFISMVSHEYRTPLTVIQSASDIIKYYLIKDETRLFDRQIIRIQQCVNSMTSILDEVLFIGRPDSSRLNLKKIKVDLTDYINEQVTNLKLIDKGNHRFIVNCNPEQIFIFIDYLVLNHIFSNLISNAVKYSPEESTIEISLREDASEIFCDITDQGIGIPSSEISHLYEPFHRFSNGLSKQGTGLGLSIVKRALDSADGKIEIISEINQGTTVKLRFKKI
ncbi:MAG: multi-sensor signal transduction histidine kinase [Ignavibacteria bacterium]|nr:multi-sensor signal transduction histidine kinase [Ignavibacteria bacterium]